MYFKGYGSSFLSENRVGGTLSHLFYEASLILISKPEKDATEKILQTNIFNKHRHKYLKTNTSK